MKKTGKIFSLLLAFCLLSACLPAARAEAAETAEMTVMVYMIGSNLESDNGAATKDLQEMVNARFGSDVKVVLQTGGAKRWRNTVLRNGATERYEVSQGRLNRLGTVRNKCMVDYGNLADFISWAAQNYPSRHRALILWDHGGGTLGGFGYDENYPKQRLYLADIAEALETAAVHFDWIGFDACLMGTLETAVVLSPYADYLIASEESEPAVGWYYTDYLTALGKNPRMSAAAQGKQIIDDYAATVKPGQFTLSLIDLSAVDDVYTELSAYFADSAQLLENYKFQELSTARSNCKSFGNGTYDQIDIVDYASRVRSISSDALIDAVDACVVYNGGGTKNAYGLAMYYPYKYPANYQSANEQLYKCGIDIYPQYYDPFVSVLVGAQQTQTNTVQSYTGTSVSIQDLLNLLWYNADTAAVYTQEAQSSAETYNNLKISYDNREDCYVLSLSNEEWKKVTAIEQCVMADDGYGYIDLGRDSYWTYTRSGDLKVDFDYNWVALDGQTVAFYTEAEETFDDGSWYSYGYTPAVLNNEADVDVILYWDDANPDGYVAGWRYAGNSEGQSSKGWYEFYVGDTLDFCCDGYTYDGEFDGVFYFGDTYEVGSYLPVVSYQPVGYDTVLINYHLTDIFQNQYYTESVEIAW